MPLYRVSFAHVRYRVTFEVLIRALTSLDAQNLARVYLSRKCRETVGPAGDWHHKETMQVDEREGTQDGQQENA